MTESPEPPELRDLVRRYARFAATSPDYKALWEAGNKIMALQGQAIGSTHATLCYLRDLFRKNGLDAFKICDGITLDDYLAKAIRELV